MNSIIDLYTSLVQVLWFLNFALIGNFFLLAMAVVYLRGIYHRLE